MDHKDAVRLRATERYLLNELDPDQLDQFEEHLFDCPDCAVDVRTAAMFVEQSKNVLAADRATMRAPAAVPARERWLSWFRPAFAMPAMAVILAVVGYQNFSLRKSLHEPRLLPWAQVNVGTYGGDGPVVSA